MTGPDDLARVLLPVMNAAGKAGDAILSVYGGAFAVELKDDRSPLTEADKRSHVIIAGALASIPGASFPVLSEEGKDTPFEERRNWETFWLIDPLDGTREFIKRNGEFTVNIALVRNARPVLGVILVPVKGLLYLAWPEAGAWRLDGGSRDRFIEELARDGAPSSERLRSLLEQHAVRLSCTSASDRPFTVVASRSHISPETADRLHALQQEHPELATLSAGSSLKFCLVAEGAADEYPRFAPTMEWDTAAGQAIVEQAGGVVLDRDTQAPLVYNKRSLLNPWFIARCR